jgi:two-component system, NarL family, response regulator NreC
LSQIRLLIADDHPVVRAGLRTLLAAHKDMVIVGEAEDGAEAIARTHELSPDVVVTDISMSGMSGLEATREIRASSPSTKVLVLTIHDDEEYLRQMLAAGATGYLLKETADTELAIAIRAVHRGDMFIYPALTKVLLGDASQRKEQPEQARDEGYASLSSREKEVLRLVALGDTNREIAARLYLSIRTVETYRSRIMEKLDLRSRGELVRYALRKGLRQDPDLQNEA